MPLWQQRTCNRGDEIFDNLYESKKKKKKKKIKEARTGAKDRFVGLSQNISTWGPKTKKFVDAYAKDYDIMGFLEHHQGDAEVTEMDKYLKNAGLRPFSAPAMPTERSERGTSGGATVAVKANWQITQLPKERQPNSAQWPQGMGHDWVATIVL